jgi:hypothetical protein
MFVGLGAQHSLAEFDKNYVGINVGSASDWESAFMFANAMNSSREWQNFSGAALSRTQVDENGWPKVDAKVFTMANKDIHGRYTLYFEGTADVHPGGWGSISGKETINGRTKAYIDMNHLPDERGKNCWLEFRNTNGGVRNVRLMRPIYPGAQQSHDTTEVFCRAFLNVVKKFDFVRYMDFLGTNSDDYHLRTSWDNRVRPTNATQNVHWRLDPENYYSMYHPTDKAGNGNRIDWFSSHGHGAAYEYLIMLANATQTDAWVCIPHVAGDDFIRKIALACKYGTDGKDPYTAPVANPVYPPLNANLKLYVEYSNEVWNWNFNQNKYVYELYKAANDQPGSELNRYSAKLPYAWYNYVAKRTAEISVIFRSVFGNDQMMSRVRPLLEWQKGNGGNANNTGSNTLIWLNDYYCPKMSQGGEFKGVDYYIWGGGGTGYYQGADVNNLNALWNDGEFNAENWRAAQHHTQQLLAAFGLRRAIYEGGPSFGDQNAGGSASSTIGELATRDIRIKSEIVEHQKVFNEAGGGAFGYYLLSGDYRWGFMEFPSDTNSPKLQGIDAIKNQPRDPITAGAQVAPGQPAKIYGGQWFMCNTGWGGNVSTNDAPTQTTIALDPGVWRAWDFHVTQHAKCAVQFTYTSTAQASAIVYHGSKQLGTLALAPSSGQPKTTQQLTTIATNDMLHAIRIKILGSKVTINELAISYLEAASTKRALNSPARSEAFQSALIQSPAGSQLKLTHHHSATVSLLRLNGTVLRSWSVTGRGTTALPLGHCAAGAYILSVQSPSESLRHPVVLR